SSSADCPRGHTFCRFCRTGSGSRSWFDLFPSRDRANGTYFNSPKISLRKRKSHNRDHYIMTKSTSLKVAVLIALVATPSIAFAGNPVPEAGSTCALLGLAVTGIV